MRVFGKITKKMGGKIPTSDIFRTFGKEYKCIFVGDAQMSPYEIITPGGGNEHFNDEPGSVWLERAVEQWPSNLWINPTPKMNGIFTFNQFDKRNFYEQDGTFDNPRN